MQALKKKDKQAMKLLIAIEQDQLTITRNLLNAGANPHIKDEYDNSPMSYALKKKDLSFVKLLIAKKVNVNRLVVAQSHH